jgi:NADH-quinone oxidoreductase subunit I
MSAIKSIVRSVADLWSLVVGLQITGRYFTQSQVTVHYPRKEIAPEVNESFRGPIELVPNPRAEGKSKCTACLICVPACPSNCITVVKAPAPVITAEQEKAFQEAEARGEEVERPTAPREPVVWNYDFSLCSLCGICIEACPVKSNTFSHKLYGVGTDRKDFLIDNLAPFIKLDATPAVWVPKAEETP